MHFLDIHILEHFLHKNKGIIVYIKPAYCVFKHKIFLIMINNKIIMIRVLDVILVTSMAKINHIEPKYRKITIKWGKL